MGSAGAIQNGKGRYGEVPEVRRLATAVQVQTLVIGDIALGGAERGIPVGGIPVQDAVRSAGSTNGAAIHLTEKAVPVIVIGVPVRYAHTHYGISAYSDFDNAVKLACEILKRLDEEQVMSF